MMRCLALTAAMVEQDKLTKPIFVLDEDGGEWRDNVINAGFAVVFEGEVPSGPWAGIVLDSYQFSEKNQNICYLHH